MKDFSYGRETSIGSKIRIVKTLYTRMDSTKEGRKGEILKKVTLVKVKYIFKFGE